MWRLSLILLMFCLTSAYAQSTEKYEGPYAQFYRAEDLFEKAKYSAAEEEYKLFMLALADSEDPLFVKAKYYHAICALRLYHANAELLLLNFLKEYPESIYEQMVFLELGRHYYQKKNYKATQEWLEKIDVYDLEADVKEEYYFKLGYAYFRNDELKKARDAFYEVINKEGQFQSPALYYYSHIAYTEKSYQTALEGFTKLKTDPSFKETVPYYIAQIYYLQGKYDMLLEYAPNVVDSSNTKNAVGMAHLVGDAFYKIGKYDEAVPFLEEYNRKSATTRDEDYQLGYAYFKSEDYDKAINMFDKVAKTRDELGQISFYHIGECYLKKKEYFYARSAFEQASVLPFDAAIEEDALYNYAVLSYKLDYNPFDEAVEALNLYLSRYPKSPRNQDVYQYLVNVYTTMKNYKGAIESIDRIEDKDFKMKSAYQIMNFNYGVELFENGDLAGAIIAFKLVKRYPMDPKLNAKSLYWIAESLFATKDYNGTIAQYRAFIAEPGSYALPEHNDAYYNIAYAYFMQADYKNAIQNFRTFTQAENETNKGKLTDAYLRIGDSYFIAPTPENVKPEDENAILFYQKAIETGGGQSDYAKYQIGLSYGYLKRYQEKASIMLDIVNNHAKSPLVISALYEVGEAYRLQTNAQASESRTKALRYYNQLIVDYPNDPKVIDAIFQIGALHFVAEEYELAEKQFLKIVKEYKNESKKQEALQRLNDVYIAMNQPDRYFKLLSEIGIEISQEAKDSTSFNAAYNAYSKGNYKDAITSFRKYLNEFLNPIEVINALYYLADSYQKTGQEENRIITLKTLLTKETNSYTEIAAAAASQDEYDRKNYEQALTYYVILERTASYPENKLKANIGIMRSHAFLKDYSSAKPYAKRILADPLALENVVIEAHYVIGKAELEANNFDVALTEFKEVSKKTTSVLGAEAQYSIALIYHLREEYKLSENEVRIMMKEKAGYDYWVAKALILQAKNSIGLNDYVQAEFTINSVLKGYTINDDGILEEANEVMQVIKDYKNQEKQISPSVDNIIEIGDGK